MRSFIVVFTLLAALGAGPALADVDPLEDIGSDGTIVDTRVIAGVTVSIATAPGTHLVACTYDSLPAAFAGPGLGGPNQKPNHPDQPGNVSGARFLGSLDGKLSQRFNTVEPIVFTFDAPVRVFGLTTLDLLETHSGAASMVRLQGFDADGQLVVEQVLSGEQGPSGLDLDWSVTWNPGLTRAVLTGTIGAGFAGFGIDDIVLEPVPVATESTTWGAIKALYR